MSEGGSTNEHDNHKLDKMAPKKAKEEKTANGSPLKRDSDRVANVSAQPMSPVLHGLKMGCKRSMDDCAPLALAEVGSRSKLRRQTSNEGYVTPLSRKRATLILDDGSRWEGYSFGSEESVSGEVVFNTSMVGYPEALTDPSYRGQLLTLTYPLVGNYGVPAETKDDLGLSVYYESDSIHITGACVSFLVLRFPPHLYTTQHIHPHPTHATSATIPHQHNHLQHHHTHAIATTTAIIASTTTTARCHKCHHCARTHLRSPIRNVSSRSPTRPLMPPGISLTKPRRLLCYQLSSSLSTLWILAIGIRRTRWAGGFESTT